MVSVAVSWDLYLATRSALVLGNVGLVQVTPFVLFALFAGHVADRYDRRLIMISAQGVQLGGTLLLLLAHGSVPLIYTALFFTASARSFQGPARQALLPNVVPGETLGKAITWNSSAQEIASVSGPALSGLLLATLGSRTVYFTQIGCALLALACFFFIRLRSTGGVEMSAREPGQLLEGLRFVRANKLILSAISLDLFAVLFGGATALLPIYAIDILHVGAHGLGWLRAAPSIGAVSMALLLAHSPRLTNAGKMLLAAVAGFGAATIVFGLSKSFWLSFAALVLTGVFDNVSVVLRQSLVQLETPDRTRGRVFAVNNIFISCSNQLGAVESGWTAQWFGPIWSVVFGGIATITIVAGFFGWAGKLRRWKL